MAYTQSMEVDEKGNLHRSLAYHTDSISKERWIADYVKEGKEEIRDCLFFKNTIPNASAVIFRKSVYSRISKEYTDLKYCGDWMLWIALLHHGRIFFSSRVLNYFRFHQNSTRNQVTPNFLRAKLGEQYLIVNHITLVSKIAMRKRLRIIFEEVSRTYKLRHIIKAVFDLRSYQQAVPFLKIIWYSILVRLKRNKSLVTE